MKKLVIVGLVSILGLTNVPAADGARVTRLSKDVKLVSSRGMSRAAHLNELIPEGAAIETGAGSQAELRFANGALLRLAAKSLVRLGALPRQIDLVRGAVLVRTPGGVEVRVQSGPVSTSVVGTTSLLEFYPQAYTKLIVLDGTARMFMPAVVGESVLVDAGQLLMFQANAARSSLPNPVDIDLKRIMTTSLLIQGFSPLGSETSISKGMQSQKQKKSEGALADTNLVIFGRGTLVSLVPPEAPIGKNAPSPSPSPKPSPVRAH